MHQHAIAAPINVIGDAACFILGVQAELERLLIVPSRESCRMDVNELNERKPKFSCTVRGAIPDALEDICLRM